jgi:hypothetical protein
MTDNEKEIENAATNMIERYGDDALKEVDLRVLELESRGQQEALQLWLEIRTRIQVLLGARAGSTRH